MPKGIAPPIPASVLDLPRFAPVFTPLTSQTLGNAATTTDGFEPVLAELGRALLAQPSAFAALDALGNDAAGTLQQLDAIPTADLDQQIAQAVSSAGPGLDAMAAGVAGLMFNPAQIAGIPPTPRQPTITAAGLGPTAGGSPVSIGDAALPGIIAGSVVTAAGGLAAAGLISTATLATVAVAVPIVGAVVAVGLLLLHYFGGGCGTACTDAARAEQIYEAASDNLYAIAKTGMISPAQAIYAMQQWIAAGTQHLSQFHTDQAKAGAANLTRVISAEILATRALPVISPRALDINAARKLYVMSGNWYYESLQAAAQLTDTYLENLPKH